MNYVLQFKFKTLEVCLIGNDDLKRAEEPYEIFIGGETIDLVIPSVRAIVHDNWHSWFNDPETNRYIDYGLFPNTPEKQIDFLSSLQEPGCRRLVLLIVPKDVGHAVGVVSLSNIDFIHRSAETAVVIGKRPTAKKSMFWAIEAKARIVQHGFERLGLRRIGGGQAMPIAVWQNYQLLFGFRPEGVKRASFSKGYEVFDCVNSSCTYDDYLRVKNLREGNYWPGASNLLKLMRSVPKISIATLVQEAIDDVVENFTKGIKLS